ncbi:MAG: hypothetical protein ABR881_17590 [Candidatus Sulfotelmatobacter sp.]|jgi:hypothetical protein
MLIIFGGLPGTGKTAIAQQLARELGAVYLLGFDVIVILLYIVEVRFGQAYPRATPRCLARKLQNLQDFPEGAQQLLGDELQLIQFGGRPKDAKPFTGVGRGVLEIALRYASDALPCPAGVTDGLADSCFARRSKEIEERH